MIHFIKIASYPLRPEEGDEYAYLCDLTLQRIDPATEKLGSLTVPSEVVFCSTLDRAIGCVECNPQQKLISLTELTEIPFDMESVSPRAEWEKSGSRSVREGFLRAFVTDTLGMSRSKIFEETEAVLKHIRQSLNEQQEVCVVSHSFRMKIIEAYIGTQGRLKDAPELLGDYLKPSERTYAFGEGFSVPIESILMSTTETSNI